MGCMPVGGVLALGHHHGNMGVETQNAPYPQDSFFFSVSPWWESIGSEFHKDFVKIGTIYPAATGIRMAPDKH